MARFRMIRMICCTVQVDVAEMLSEARRNSRYENSFVLLLCIELFSVKQYISTICLERQ